MAFFSLTDIKYISGQNRDSEFALNANNFDAYNRRYPIDIGNTDKGHYMTFFIFTQERTQVEGYQQGGYMLDPTGGNATVLDSSERNVISAFQFGANEFLDNVQRNTEVDESVSINENIFDGNDAQDDGTTFGIQQEIQKLNSSGSNTLKSIKNQEIVQN